MYHAATMIKISVSDEINKALHQLQSVAEAKQFRFAVAKALTVTAAQVQAEVRQNMPGRFQIRKDWVIKGIKMEKATKDDLTATVYSRDAFMGLQEVGGPKDPRGHYLAIPTISVRRTPRELIRKSDRPKALGEKATIVDYNGKKWLALRSGPYHKRLRKEGRLRLMYLLIPVAQIQKRLGLGEDAMKVVRMRFSQNLKDALEYAMSKPK